LNRTASETANEVASATDELVRVYVAVGANLGDAAANVRRAFACMTAQFGPVRTSTLYATEPIDCPPNSPVFVNAAVRFDTRLAPLALLVALRNIELQFGRPSVRSRNAPRLLDLDLIAYGDVSMNTAALTLPHPRAHQRTFVLAPLAELAPDLCLPGQTQTVRALLSSFASVT
jgi:2-amino-4-hydroxy-6-hydroxymethyldihydropteridine diphosphokinase